MNAILIELNRYQLYSTFIFFQKKVLNAVSLLTGSSERQDAEAAVKRRNLQAERILNTYGNAILRFAYSYLHNLSDAEDVLQDTLICFLQKGRDFHSPAHEKAWLLKVAGNLSKNKLRYNAVRQHDELDENLILPNEPSLKELWDAVKALPSPSREVIHLYYYEGYSTAEISRMLGRREATVRSDLHRGRMHLKAILKEGYDFA